MRKCSGGGGALDLLSLQSEQCSCYLCCMQGLCVDFLRRKDSNARKKNLTTTPQPNTETPRALPHVCASGLAPLSSVLLFS